MSRRRKGNRKVRRVSLVGTTLLPISSQFIPAQFIPAQFIPAQWHYAA